MKLKIKFTQEEIRKINRKVDRENEIANGMNVNRHRVHKNLKAYNRKDRRQKIEW